MTVTYPSAYVITPGAALVLPPADASPLSTGLSNGNAAYVLHAPQVTGAIYTVNTALTRQSSFRLPVTPSADGLTYRFRHYVRTGTGTTAITWSVEEQSSGGGWSSVASGTEAAAASSVIEISHTGTINATSDELRIRYSRGGDPYTPDSVTVYPDGTDNPSARTACGFWPYDDALFASSGAPINTEFVNRPVRNARAVVADRAQQLLSFAQEDDSTVANVRFDLTSANVGPGDWIDIGHGYAATPYMAQGATVGIYAIASVSAGSTADIVRVSAGGPWVEIDADGTVQAVTVAANVEGAGTAQARIRWSIQARRTGSNETFLHAVTADYQPPLTSTDLLVTTVDAPASTALLSAALRGAEDLLVSPWCQPAHCYDGNTDSDTRRFVSAIPPAVQYARAAIVRSQHGAGSVQSDSTIAATTVSGVPASPAAAIVTVDAPTNGTESYFDVDGGKGWPIVVWSSGDNMQATPPGSTKDRALNVIEALAPSYEVVEVHLSCGFGLHYARVRAPADWIEI
jgi:hypothetical protein